ncbi:MAG: MFS transporter [Flavobacteriaceae bacterium]
MEQNTVARTTAGRAALLVGALCSVYFFSQFLRNSIGVIAPEIAAEFAMSPAVLSLLASSFFISFAAVQIPLGIAIDHFGAIRSMTVLMGLTIVGCVVFASADTASGLIAGRAIMGLGCSAFFMAPLTIYTRWFGPQRFSTLVGLTLGIGSFGSLAVTTPLALLSGAVGWRTAFLVVAAASAVVFVFCLAIARERPPGAAAPPRAASLSAVLKDFPAVFRVHGVARLFVMHCFTYSIFATMLGLWAGPYFSDVHGLDLTARGNALFVFAMAQITALLVWGPADRLMGGHKLPVTIGALATIVMLCVIAFSDSLPVGWVIAEFALLGVAAAYTPVLTAHGRALFELSMVGRGMTLMNIGTMGGVVVLQLATGQIVGWLSEGHSIRDPHAYRAAFLFIAAMLALALVFYRRAPEGIAEKQ